MSVSIKATPVRLTVTLSGEIDHHNASVLRCEADEAIQKFMTPNVRFDFGDVTFMDSSGIGFILGRYRIVNSYGGNVEVVELTNRLYQMMRMAGLEKIVKLRRKGNKNETIK